MDVTCRSCGAALPAGAGRCPSCLAIVKPPGFWQRLLGGLKVSFNVETNPEGTVAPGIHFKTTVKRTYKFRDSKTGEFKEYHSLDEMPPEVRALFEQAQKDLDSKP